MKTMETGWHFVGDTLRDGTTVPPDGEWLEYDGPLVLCKFGLHFSRCPFDAWKYASGKTLCRVEVDGVGKYYRDKGVASRRRIIQRIDATDLLRAFARSMALSVIHLWDAPKIVVEYLKTGDESKRTAARAAAGAARAAAARAARAAAARAAEDSAEASVWAAVIAARRAADAAAWAAARTAKWDAASTAAWTAAWDTARADFTGRVHKAFGIEEDEGENQTCGIWK